MYLVETVGLDALGNIYSFMDAQDADTQRNLPSLLQVFPSLDTEACRRAIDRHVGYSCPIKLLGAEELEHVFLFLGSCDRPRDDEIVNLAVTCEHFAKLVPNAHRWFEISDPRDEMEMSSLTKRFGSSSRKKRI